MALTKEEKNKEEINTFLKNNDIDPNNAMGYDNKFEIRYYIDDSRRFSEETRIGFNTLASSYINVSLYEINDIEYETQFKITEQTFSFDDVHETLTIVGTGSKKHSGEYKVVISSIYLDY